MKRFVVVAALLAIAGCGKQKEGDCKTLVQNVGPAHASLSEAFGRSDAPPDQLETEAAGWEETAKSLSALDLKDEGVKALANDFAEILRKGAKLRREMATAANALDPTAAAKSQAGAVAFATEEMQVKAKVDMTCR